MMALAQASALLLMVVQEMISQMLCSTRKPSCSR
jgi:hypothetical protein